VANIQGSFLAIYSLRRDQPKGLVGEVDAVGFDAVGLVVAAGADEVADAAERAENAKGENAKGV
jgi:hypothetical protein